MKTLVIILIVSFCGASFQLLAQAPGNVTGNLQVWLKANSQVNEADGTTAEANEGVDNWGDNTGNDNDAETGEGSAATRPIYRTGIINGYEALEFDGTKFLDLQAAPGIGDTESFQIFMVFRQSSYVPGGNDANGTFIIDRRDATANLASFKMVTGNKYFYQRRQTDGSNLGGVETNATAPTGTGNFVIASYFRATGSTTEGIYLNGNLDKSQTGVTGNMPAPLLKIGNHADFVNSDSGLKGYFAEMAIYDANLSNANRRRIESYLAIKYGITLASTVDYVSSDGTVIYPSTGSHSGYTTDIAGIGQDDDSALDQEASASQNPGNMFSVTTANSVGDDEFLVWGHNNGSIAVPNTTDVASPVIRRLQRVWRANEIGEVGANMTVVFDLGQVPGAKTPSHIKLLVDNDGVFATSPTSYNVSSSTGSRYTFTGVDIDDNQYFTIGTINISTPLPIELADFTVSYEAPQVVASWKTASELNNDYFTLERAGEDLSFDELARQPGAGTTKEPRSYSAIDPYPFEGKSYYRLKQTDYDGTSTYSAPRFIFVEGSGNKLTIFPNPNTGQSLNLKLGSSRFQLTEVEVLSQQGAILHTENDFDANANHYTVTFSKPLASGMYFMRVKYNGKQEYLKFIVH